MVPFFPKQVAYRAIITYLAALIAVSLFYFEYAMKLGYMALGLAFVVGFFSFSCVWSKQQLRNSDKEFVRLIFISAVVIRLIWVVVSYFYYIKVTGIPFEYGAADSIGYHEEAKWLTEEGWGKVWEYYFGPMASGISDVGYPLYLTVLYNIFGPVIIIPRIIKAFLSAFSCVLIYKLASRTFGESAGRIAGIMMVLMPNLIIYCGYHLKETEMVFLEIAFLERLDFLIRTKKYNFTTIFVPSLLAGLLFFFRTVLGAAAIFAFATAIMLSSTPTLANNTKRAVLVGWGILCLALASGGTIMTEFEALWEERDSNVDNKRTEQTLRGNQWAQYATGTVMAPLAFVLPFATMIDVDQQYSQQTKSGGNYIRNFMGIFAFLAIYEAIRRKKWRDFAMIGSFVIAYLGVISLSGFSNSERFLLPGIPCLIMMWAYGISTLRKQTYRLLTPWCFVVLAMEIGWAFFKLGSRGIL